MKRTILLFSGLLCAIALNAERFNYKFNSTRLTEALDRIAEEHPSIYLNFIYNELDRYTTSAAVDTDNAYDALRQTIGLNPVSVVRKGDRYYVEALQHGRYTYTGRAIGSDNEPVEAATVLLLSPKDSTMLTYGITDASGRFSIPCDRTEVIAKLSCVGYKTTYHDCHTFNIGNIVMNEEYVRLNRVTVEASAATAYSDKTVYRPSARQKRAATNATDLLRFVAIPQIKVDPVSDAVTDNVGMGVRLFINGTEASPEELQGLPTGDVRTVEYLEYPQDPRFKGAERAVNFIVQEYAYGGYTKLSAREDFIIGLVSNVNAFSKFNYKKMSYDLYVGAKNYNNHHRGTSTASEYLLTEEGKAAVVTRDEIFQNSHYVRNDYPVTFRATYNSDKVQIRNTVGYTSSEIPVSEYSGLIRYSDRGNGNVDFHRSNPSVTNSAAYGGSFYFSLPKKFAVDITPTFNYSHIDDRMNYTVSNRSAIVRHARENAYVYRVDAYLRKTFNQTHSLMAGVNHGNHINRLTYTGTSDYTDRFRLSFAAAIAGYNFHTKKISLNTDIGLAWEGSDINGKRYNDIYPFAHINLQYAFSKKHVMATYIQYATNSPTISYKTSDVLQDNEYLYITGNPYVRNARHVTFNLTYTWLPSNRFSMSAYGQYYGVYDRLLTVYMPYDDGKAVLRSYTNDGDFNRTKIGVSANLKLFGGKLQFYVSPEQAFYGSTGIYHKTYTPFIVTAQAVLYLGNFYFQAYYKSPDKKMSSEAPLLYRTRNYHSVAAGWSDNHWNLRLTAFNFLNKGWESTMSVIESPYYSQRQQEYNTIYHPLVSLNCTYTFNYGKKVQRSNEIGQQDGASSAILK